MALIFSASLCALGASPVPLPTEAQLNYQRQEIVALVKPAHPHPTRGDPIPHGPSQTHFNMATFFRNGDPACDASNWAESQKPSSFAPTRLNISNWIEGYKAIGARSAILTAKHGCGFLLWPTNVTLPDGSNYNYHVGGNGGLGVNVAKEFAEKMSEAGLPPAGAGERDAGAV